MRAAESPYNLRDQQGAMSADVFSEAKKCSTAWSALVGEWKKTGGGIKESIGEARAQIMANQASKFAKLIYRTWNSQWDSANKEALGSWPVGDEEFRRVTMALTGSISAEVPDACKAGIWLEGALWDEVHEGNSVRRLAETPSSMRWDSSDAHDASNWLIYWLLVR